MLEAGRRSKKRGLPQKQRGRVERAAIRHVCGFGLSGDQKIFAGLSGLDLCAEPERHAAAAGPDLVGVLWIAVLRRHPAGLAAAAAGAVTTAADFQELGKL
jgi:hypothetical protein